MRRTALLRALTAIWGFWFAAAFLELPGAHACAVHGAGATAPAAHAHHHGAPSQHKGPQCTCLSHCTGTSAAVLSAPSFAVATSTVELAAIEHRAPAVVIIARPHARPFANGPPVA